MLLYVIGRVDADMLGRAGVDGMASAVVRGNEPVSDSENFDMDNCSEVDDDNVVWPHLILQAEVYCQRMKLWAIRCKASIKYLLQPNDFIVGFGSMQ